MTQVRCSLIPDLTLFEDAAEELGVLDIKICQDDEQSSCPPEIVNPAGAGE